MIRPRPKLFRGRHFQDEIIALCSVVPALQPELPGSGGDDGTERGLTVDHSAIARWVLRYAPELSKRIRRHLRRPGSACRVDDTYVRVGGAWLYLYRAIDSQGDTIDFMLSPKRDLVAARQLGLARGGRA
jgi:transposase, IS6 family